MRLNSKKEIRNGYLDLGVICKDMITKPRDINKNSENVGSAGLAGRRTRARTHTQRGTEDSITKKK